MIPIPDYLKELPVFEKGSKNKITFSLRCKCGCHSFFVFENYLTKDEEQLLKPYYDVLHYLYGSGGYGTTGYYVDENGMAHTWKYLSPAGKNGPKEDVIIPPKPICAGISVIKIKCATCGKEYLLFDSRQHGYDGMAGNKSSEEMDYQPHFRQRGKQPLTLQVKIENDESLEAFHQNSGLNFSEAEYSNAFSWMAVYRVNENGKKIKIFEFETA